MTGNCETYGTLALEPQREETGNAVIMLDWFRGDEPEEKSAVERTLDDFEGEPFAKTASERRFAAVALAVAGFAMLFFSFAPIF